MERMVRPWRTTPGPLSDRFVSEWKDILTGKEAKKKGSLAAQTVQNF
jgi:hypothetical protein